MFNSLSLSPSKKKPHLLLTQILKIFIIKNKYTEKKTNKILKVSTNKKSPTKNQQNNYLVKLRKND